ncbi:serine protease [Epilithonimonas sp. JDS]|uniref:S1 family peptidase n=1 Tax=Epilithonimonas sp. JDS TaxID=2902797 RepID=UPI001E4EDBDF|nr:serine protease [Epilithonimonas sp. JDS]MCD9855987.1 serine protease [Epilithonimonas sp. JDS]
MITLENLSFSTFLSVESGKSIGSGFRLIHEQIEYIVTAKHVIYDENTLLSDTWIISRNYDSLTNQYYDATILLNKQNVKTFSDLDIVLIKLTGSPEYHVENIGENISIPSLQNLTDYEGITIGSTIFQVGFPYSLTSTEFYEINSPLLRYGIVAGKNIKNKTFIIDSIAYYGVSGGPVLQKNGDEFSIIGIVSRFVPFITEWRNKHEKSLSRQDFFNSGYAICLPLDIILKELEYANQ